MKIACKYDELMDPNDLALLFNPDNNNIHDEEQIKHLIYVIEVNHFRKPITISNQSGLISAGHGRVMAAIMAGWEKVPVVYQDYDSDEQEYQDLTADNAIGNQSKLNFKKANEDLVKYGPALDLKAMGIKDFHLDVSDKIDIKLPEDKPKKECPACGEILNA